jgi:hypothetical protein
MSAGRASLVPSAYPDLAETVIFMSGRSSILQQGVREWKREEGRISQSR